MSFLRFSFTSWLCKFSEHLKVWRWATRRSGSCQFLLNPRRLLMESIVDNVRGKAIHSRCHYEITLWNVIFQELLREAACPLGRWDYAHIQVKVLYDHIKPALLFGVFVPVMDFSHAIHTCLRCCSVGLPLSGLFTPLTSDYAFLPCSAMLEN